MENNTAKKTLTTKRLDNLQFLVLALPAILLLVTFAYIPMGGVVIAFEKFNVTKGIWGSPWIGLKNFEFFFKSSDAWRTIRNTLGLNLLFMSVGLVASISFAMLCFYLRSKRAIKIYQTVTLVPSFLSMVIVGYLVYSLLKPSGGVVNQLVTAFGGTPVNWYSQPQYWPVILLVTILWHGVGNGSLFYFASLMGIDTDYFEAASLDGATRWQQFRYIIIPFLIPLIVIIQTLNIGKIFRSDFGLFFNVTQDSGALYATTDVIDTYIYRSLIQIGDIGMSAAVGLFQSGVGFVLILLTNFIVRRIDSDSALF
ncbi:MAG: carbohydrate transporter rane protein 1, family [Paenibacillaceae bacterium]|jgi:putative aldouronate transport system permease protein|nr:carbohydrate transporter rane protein 1, family [Paenibacillaceae bacterium]